MGKLTSKTVESIAKAATPGKTNDGDGLYFQVSKSGGTSWIFRYKLDGRSREMGLGPFPTVTLSQARQLAADQRKLLASGSDPLATRDAAKEAKREAERQAARRTTFEDLARQYQQAHGSSWSEKWRKPAAQNGVCRHNATWFSIHLPRQGKRVHHLSAMVCELAPAHDERNQTEVAYSRSDLLEKRRPLMRDWAKFCTSQT